MPTKAATYTLTFDTDDGPQKRPNRTRKQIDTLGALVSRAGDRGQAWNIAVLDEAGDDVTFDFTCFQD